MTWGMADRNGDRITVTACNTGTVEVDFTLTDGRSAWMDLTPEDVEEFKLLLDNAVAEVEA